MCHCVGTYAKTCSSGRSSIWTFRAADADGRQTQLPTLEVLNAHREIVHARRRRNGTPSPQEVGILRRCADSGRPSLSRWLET